MAKLFEHAQENALKQIASAKSVELFCLFIPIWLTILINDLEAS